MKGINNDNKVAASIKHHRNGESAASSEAAASIARQQQHNARSIMERMASGALRMYLRASSAA